jgi:hypothetical protein
MKYLAVCAIVKNEPAIKAWVDYHILAGVEHFVLYDNGCEIPLTRQLARYIAENVATVVDWPFDKGQIPAYANCLERFRGNFRWIAFIDADECLLPKTGDDLRPLLLDYEDCAALAAHWVVFGSNGHVSRPPGPFIEHYTRAYAKSMHLKMIVRPELTVAPLTPHNFELAPGARCVNEEKAPVYGAFSYHVSDKIQINHYYFRSQQDYCEKTERGFATPVLNRNGYLMEEFYEHLDFPCFEERTILKYLDRLKIFGKKDPALICRLAKEWSELTLESYAESVTRLMETGKLARAKDVLGLMQCYHGHTAVCHYLHSTYHRLRGDLDAARAAATRALAVEPSPEIYYELFCIAKAQNQPDRCARLAQFIRKGLTEENTLTPDWETKLRLV